MLDTTFSRTALVTLPADPRKSNEHVVTLLNEFDAPTKVLQVRGLEAALRVCKIHSAVPIFEV